ncbi:MAG: outer membrane beta-barrel protein, partial [Bacteroidota bacterium]
IILSLGFITCDTATVLAEEDDQQYYLGLQIPYIWIGGDFDNDFYELEEESGYGVNFGATKDIYSCEFNYSQSEHNVLNYSPKSTAKFESLNVSVKVSSSSFNNRRFSPYGLIGWGITNLSIENGAMDLDTGKYYPIKCEGTGFHLGFGLNCKLNKKVAIDGLIAHYRYSIDKIKIPGTSYEPHEPPKYDVMLINTVASLGIQYYF